MRIIKEALLVIFIVFAAIVLLGFKMPFITAPATGSIEGFIIDQAGVPVARARVQASNIFYGGCFTSTSEPNGFYRVAELPGGRYSLWIEAKGHNSEWIPLVVVEEGKATRKDIQLKRDIPTESFVPALP
jgi:hypothetical protein